MASLPSVQALPDGQSLASGFPVDPCTDERCCIRTSGRVSAGIFSFSSDPCLYWSHYLIKHVSLKMQFPPHQHWGCSTLFQTCNGTIDLRLSPRLPAHTRPSVNALMWWGEAWGTHIKLCLLEESQQKGHDGVTTGGICINMHTNEITRWRDETPLIRL